MCSTMICRSSQRCGEAEFTCAHICFWPQVELRLVCSLYSLLYFHLPLCIIPPSSSSFLHSFQSLTFNFALSSLWYSFHSFRIQLCIFLLSFSQLFCSLVCNSISRALLLSFRGALLHLQTQMWVPALFCRSISYPKWCIATGTQHLTVTLTY